MKKVFNIIILLFSLSVFATTSANIKINEFMASNATSVPEMYDFEDYSDWIEIYNGNEEPFDIGGYYLTDNLNDSTKWRYLIIRL